MRYYLSYAASLKLHKSTLPMNSWIWTIFSQQYFHGHLLSLWSIKLNNRAKCFDNKGICRNNLCHNPFIIESGRVCFPLFSISICRHNSTHQMNITKHGTCSHFTAPLYLHYLLACSLGTEFVSLSSCKHWFRANFE